MARTISPDQFKDIEQIDSGSRGLVYRALDLATGKPVAIKVFDKEGVRPVYVEGIPYRYMDAAYEARVLKDLEGIPYFPELVGVGNSSDRHFNKYGHTFLVKEWIEGRTLGDEGIYRFEEDRGEVIELVADAMLQAYARGYCLRDAKDVFLVRHAPRDNKLQIPVIGWPIYEFTPKLIDVGGFLPTPSKSKVPSNIQPDRDGYLPWMTSVGPMVKEFLESGLFSEDRLIGEGELQKWEDGIRNGVMITGHSRNRRTSPTTPDNINFDPGWSPYRQLLLYSRIIQKSREGGYGVLTGVGLIRPEDVGKTVGDDKRFQEFLQDLCKFTYHLKDYMNVTKLKIV